MRKRVSTGGGIAWGRLDRRILGTLLDLARSSPGERRVIRIDLEVTVQGTPTHGSLRASGRVGAMGAVRSASPSTSP